MQAITAPPHKKRADVQGLRAIAVLAVVLFHFHYALLPGGYVGVDIFFVLSGYLITGTLLRPMEAGTYSVEAFYRRRVRRLFPVLFTVLTVTLILGLIIFPPALLLAQLESHFFALLFASNLYFENKSGYFDLNMGLMPLLHTWSLGVEEQFYLIFPLVLFAFFKFARPFMWGMLLFLTVISLLYSQSVIHSDPNAAFYNPLSRTFELMIGALCVWLERNLSLNRWSKQILSGLGFIAIIASLVLIDAHSPFPGFLALVPTVGTAAIILSKDALWNALISGKAFVWVGDISYSLYLWHWPLFVFAKFLFPNNMSVLLGVLVLSFILAGLSYKYIEQPFLRKTPKHIFWKAGGLTLASLFVCLGLYYAKGLPGRFSPEAQAFLKASSDYNQDRPQCHMRGGHPMPYEDLCVYGAADKPASWIVLGDSHGTELAKVLGERLALYGQALKSSTMSGCAAVQSRGDGCGAYISNMLEAITADTYIHTVILSSNISGTDPRAEDTVAGISQSAQALAAAGKRVIIIYPLPTFDFDPPSMLAMKVRMGGDVLDVGIKRSLHDSRKAQINEALDSLVLTPNIEGINSTTLYCDEALCPAWRDNLGTLYYNAGHLSLTGATIMADEIVARYAE